MRSIIDEIANAESTAEQLRQDALTDAREKIVQAKLDAEKQLASSEAREREETRRALEAADAEGAALSKAILTDMNEAAKEQCEAAYGRLDEAVTYLLRKVQGIS